MKYTLRQEHKQQMKIMEPIWSERQNMNEREKKITNKHPQSEFFLSACVRKWEAVIKLLWSRHRRRKYAGICKNVNFMAHMVLFVSFPFSLYSNDAHTKFQSFKWEIATCDVDHMIHTDKTQRFTQWIVTVQSLYFNVYIHYVIERYIH